MQAGRVAPSACTGIPSAMRFSKYILISSSLNFSRSSAVEPPVKTRKKGAPFCRGAWFCTMMARVSRTLRMSAEVVGETAELVDWLGGSKHHQWMEASHHTDW